MRVNATKSIALNEQRLLSIYYVPPTIIIPSHDTTHGFLDRISMQLLMQHDQEVLKSYSPRLTRGDGNCFFRAVSLALFGTQEHHAYLRVLTALEMLLHPQFYDQESQVYLTNPTITHTGIHTSSYLQLISIATTPGADVELMHFYALSAALNAPIASYCPPFSSGASLHPYTTTVRGRGVPPSTATNVTVMWTTTEYTSSMNNFNPTHVVLLTPVRRRNQKTWDGTDAPDSCDEDVTSPGICNNYTLH